jgi:hypothetical protein
MSSVVCVALLMVRKTTGTLPRNRFPAQPAVCVCEVRLLWSMITSAPNSCCMPD